MAIASIIVRRSISYVLPVAMVRRVERRNHDQYSALFTALYNQYGSSTLSHKPGPPRRPFAASTTLLHFYSSSPSSSAEKETSTPSTADDTLVRAIESKIKSVEESGEHHYEAKLEELSDGFPFEIYENPGQTTIFLAREYQGEDIEAVVGLLHIVGERDFKDDFSNTPIFLAREYQGEDMEAVVGFLHIVGERDFKDDFSNTPMIPLQVRVSKKNGTYLRFCCSVFPNEITIDSLLIKNSETSEVQEIAYEGPDFEKMDENLRNAIYKYLEVRGIKPSISDFLYEYMQIKSDKETSSWLKNVKKCLEA